jgi:hypothetical protein
MTTSRDGHWSSGAESCPPACERPQTLSHRRFVDLFVSNANPSAPKQEWCIASELGVIELEPSERPVEAAVPERGPAPVLHYPATESHNRRAGPNGLGSPPFVCEQVRELPPRGPAGGDKREPVKGRSTPALLSAEVFAAGGAGMAAHGSNFATRRCAVPLLFPRTPPLWVGPLEAFRRRRGRAHDLAAIWRASTPGSFSRCRSRLRRAGAGQE